MKNISFNEAAEICFNTTQPLFITPDGKKNLILMNESTFEAYAEAKRVDDVLTGFEQKEHVVEADTFLTELRQKYGL